jgi:hypothetical protein
VQVLDGAGPTTPRAVRVDIEPGTRWRYSGGGMTVMQLLLSDVTAAPCRRCCATACSPRRG